MTGESRQAVGSRQAPPSYPSLWIGVEAGDGPRTRDPQLGKLMLYQLSYSRSSVTIRWRNHITSGAARLKGCSSRVE